MSSIATKRQWTKSWWLCLAASLLLSFALAGCGSDDTASSAQSCEWDSDCPLGTVCSHDEQCISVGCEHCQPGQVCLETDDNPEGTCSRPECQNDDECEAAGDSCVDGVCTDGGGGGGDCQSDGDCADGERCNLANECVPDDGEGCSDSSDCTDGEYCDQSTGDCEVGECYDAMDCDGNDVCNDNNECVDDSTDPCGGCPAGEVCNTQTNECETDACGGCPAGETCNTQTNQCEADTPDPCGGPCPDGQVCNTNTDQCEPEQQCDPACDPNTHYCDTATGTCEEHNCSPGSPRPEDCQADPVYNKFDPEGCYCAQCLDDSDCDTNAGEECNSNGECFVCNEACDPADGGNACSTDGYFCISGCCVECIGNADCPQDQVCNDGSCGAPAGCTGDADCAGSNVCVNNTCQPPQSGGSCTGPGDCPQGQFCDGGQCQDLTGGSGGCTSDTMCNPDCTCPSPATCELGMVCVGCRGITEGVFPSEGCPSGQECIFGMCF